MPNEVLITYVTKYGSTAEVARAIEKTLRESGVATELHDAREVNDLDRYRAVVFGAPLYNTRLLRAGRHFLARNRRALAELPLAIFVLGPLGEKESELEVPQKQFDRTLARLAEIQPNTTALFGGVIDQSKLRFPDKYSPPLKRFFPITDVREWDAIDAWAASLVDALSLK